MMKYQEESYTEIVQDIKDHLTNHFNETELYLDKIQLDPAYDIYELLYHQGVARFFVARDEDNALTGYLIIFVHQRPHAVGVLYAVSDMIYVAPEHRHTEVVEKIISTAETILSEDGVKVMLINFKAHLPCQSLMDKLEFNKVEIMYSKYISKDN